MTRLVIFGCGGMGRELADIARDRAREASWSEIVFADDVAFPPVDGIEVIPPVALREDDLICFAVGNSATRRRLAERFREHRFASLVSRTALVSSRAVMGEGAIVGDYCAINNGTQIGRHFLANLHCHVSHDCTLGDFVTLSPRVSVNGNVEIGDDVFIGAGAVIRNGVPGRPLRIGAGATVGMGAVVVADVPAGATVTGVPARAAR